MKKLKPKKHTKTKYERHIELLKKSNPSPNCKNVMTLDGQKMEVIAFV